MAREGMGRGRTWRHALTGHTSPSRERQGKLKIEPKPFMVRDLLTTTLSQARGCLFI